MVKVPLRSSTELFEDEDDAGGTGTSGGVSYNIVVERVVLLPRVVTGKLRLKKEWRMPPKESQDLGICTSFFFFEFFEFLFIVLSLRPSDMLREIIYMHGVVIIADFNGKKGERYGRR